MKKSRGLVDPYTLGFLISIIGGLTAYTVHKDDQPTPAPSASGAEATEIVIITPDQPGRQVEQP